MTQQKDPKFWVSEPCHVECKYIFPWDLQPDTGIGSHVATRCNGNGDRCKRCCGVRPKICLHIMGQPVAPPNREEAVRRAHSAPNNHQCFMITNIGYICSTMVNSTVGIIANDSDQPMELLDYSHVWQQHIAFQSTSMVLQHFSSWTYQVRQSHSAVSPLAYGVHRDERPHVPRVYPTAWQLLLV